MKTAIRFALGLLTLALCAWPTHRSFAAFDAYLKIDGIPGESTDASHKNEIEVLSWSWGMTQSGSAVPGPGVTNKVTMQDFHFVARFDKASPKLMLACAGGTNIAQVELVLRYPGGTNQVEYLNIKLENVIVSSVKTVGTATSGDVLPLEEVSFNYAKIRMTYQAVDQSGAPSGPPVTGSWDLVTNQPY